MKKLKAKQKDIVYIEFEDHCAGNSGWGDEKYIIHTICTVICVGFLVHDTPKYITVALLSQLKNSMYSETMTIVKSCVIKMVKLKRPKAINKNGSD